MRRFFLILFLVFFFCKLFAQDVSFINITTKNGLPSNTIYDLAQDSKGFIWLTTDKGLCKYDGREFRNFSSTKQSSKSGDAIQEDYLGRVWYKTFAGQLFYVENDSLLLFNNDAALSTDFRIVNKKRLFVADPKGIRQFDLGNFKLVKNHLFAKEYLGAFTSFVSDNKYCFYKNAESELGFIDASNEMQTTTRSNYYFPGEICVLNSDTFFISKNTNKLVRLCNNVKSEIVFSKKLVFIGDFKVIENELWLLTSNGIFILSDKKESVKHILENENTSAVTKDAEGNYWLGTKSKGLFFFPSIGVVLKKHPERFPTIITSYGIDLIIGFSNGEVVKRNIKNNLEEIIFRDKSQHEITSVFCKDQSEYLINGSKLVYLKKGKLEFEKEGAVKDFCLVNSNAVAIACSGALGLLNYDNSNNAFGFKNQNGVPQGQQGIVNLNSAARANAVAYDSVNKTLYGASSSGLIYCNKIKNETIKYNNEEIYCKDVLVVGDEVLASGNGNFIYIIRNNVVIEKFILSALKPENSIKKLFYYGNKLWAIHETGLSRIDWKSKKADYLNYTDGLPNAEYFDITAINDKIYLATAEGLVTFSEDLKCQNNFKPLLHINSVTVNGKKVELKNIAVLNNDQNNIEIYYSLIAFRAQDKSKVLYKINEGKWIAAEQSSRLLRLNSLTPDEYKVSIKVINEDAIECEHPVDFVFVIKPPFYQTWWFFTLVILFVILVSYLFFKWRIKETERKNVLMEDKLKLESALQQSILASIRSQMNPHFIFNALNTIQSYIFENDKKNAASYLGKFSDLTRIILEQSNKELITLKEEVLALKLYLDLEMMRFEESLVYNIQIDEKLEQDYCKLPPMIIQPYVENAVKHGLLHKQSNRELRISFSKVDNSLQVIIDDNGIGRKRAEELKRKKHKRHNSFSTNANEKRLNILNQNNDKVSVEIIDKHNEAGNATGTRVIILLPLVVL